MTNAAPEVTLRRWAKADEGPFTEPVFVFDSDQLPQDLANASVVLADVGLERARELAARGADRVLLGAAALRDGGLVASLCRELGAGRTGVWVPVRPMTVGWTLDFESNADFRCLAPSRVQPAWEVLTSDGRGAGVDAGWWIGKMLERGASMALAAVDVCDDASLNICAELMEQFGPRLWLTPLTHGATDLGPWVRYGHARNLVLPGIEHYDEAAALALGTAA